MKLLKCQEEQALELYLSRLEALKQYGLLLGQRAMFVEYDDLVDHAQDTLAALTAFLNLDSPLSVDYATHRMTGRVIGYGDPCKNIKLGHIVRTAGHQVELGESTFLTAVRAFRQCREQLRFVVHHSFDGSSLVDE
jgi:hypothetical protein